ncbi:MAG: hypothetical protein JWM11_4096 [Planctomycetaceae bacterium]|nr:hypothetical protein [Planctomycetaceae bacterium]
MPVLTAYKGIEVVEGSTGAGGIALTDDFKELADRAPMKSTSNPGSSDDSAAGFFEGSLWFNTSSQTMWVCTNNTAGSAVWKSFYTRTGAVLTLIPQESTEAVNIEGKLGVGASSPKAKLHSTESTILGVDDAAVSSGDLGNSQVNIWVDETSGAEKLKFQVKLSGGSVKSGSINLV